MKCFIVGAGQHYNDDVLDIRKQDYVIAADAGYEYLVDKNIKCDMVIGDFDSVDSLPIHDNVIKLNPIKDETDMLSAVNQGIKKGYTKFHIYGGCGKRFAHTMANIQLLTMLASKGMQGYLYGENEILTVIKDSYISFDKMKKGYISVFSLTNECIGVYEKNLKYLLDDYTMVNDYAIGVSNEFIGKESEVGVKKGTLLIAIEKNNKSF